MDTTTLIIIVVAAIVVIALIAIAVWLATRKRQSDELHTEFGPEYDRAMQQYGDRGRAEATLQQRKERVDALNIRPLAPEEQGRYAEAWRQVQARFVDDPSGAVREADSLIGQVMQARGYPVGDFEQRAADISVNHPRVVENYRAAHNIAEANARGQATTEDLRKAMVYYRALFDELLGTQPMQRREVA